MKSKLLLVGAGEMAIEYAKVLSALDVSYEVIGRGETSAREFEKNTGHVVETGGLKYWLNQNNKTIPDAAIITIGVEQLASATIDLLKYGIKYILVEKPAGLNTIEISEVVNAKKKFKSNIYVAYNRRFYASVHKAREIISNDGGVSSFHFEFTEWSHEIKNLKKAPGVKESWFLVNSSHVVDLAFNLCGVPKKISCYTSGGLSWHPNASKFYGAGISVYGALFSYQANWESPGRWGIEICTNKYRLIFRPLEKLQIQKLGSVISEFAVINDELDLSFKPGLYEQTKVFLFNPNNNLCSIEKHLSNMKFYDKISGL